MLLVIGVMQMECINDGFEVAKFYTESTYGGKIAVGAPGPPSDIHQTDHWVHVALVVDDNSSNFWINGQLKESLAYVGGEGNKRAFFSDVENIDFISIGKHMTLESNATNHFRGKIDDFYIYDNQALSGEDINFLYNLRSGRETLPRLEAVVDAIGTIKVNNAGDGYKETPDVLFSYGRDGNDTQDLTIYDHMEQPSHGSLRFWQSQKLVMSYHRRRKSRHAMASHRTDPSEDWTIAHKDGWRTYDSPAAEALLSPTIVDQVLWTKDTRQQPYLTRR